MALSTSFVTGWFFHGQFFDHAVAGHRPVDRLPRLKSRTVEDVGRSRGVFLRAHLVEEAVESVAAASIDSDDDSAVSMLFRELQRAYVDWQPEYKQQLIDAIQRLRKERDRKLKDERKAVEDWMRRRRQSKLGRPW